MLKELRKEMNRSGYVMRNSGERCAHSLNSNLHAAGLLPRGTARTGSFGSGSSRSPATTQASRGRRSGSAMAVTVIVGECAGREVIRAVAVAAIGDTCADRRAGPLNASRGRHSGSGSWNPSIQNVQIRIVKREQPRLLDGSLRKCGVAPLPTVARPLQEF